MDFKLTVKDVFVQDIVESMARYLGTEVKRTNNTTSIVLPPKFGDGEITAVQFASGLGFVVTDYELRKNFDFELENNQIHPLKIIFNLGDNVYHKFKNQEEYTPIEKFRVALVGSSVDQVNYFRVPTNSKIRLFSIEINRKLFEHKLDNFVFDLGKDLNHLLRDINGVVSVYKYFEFNLELYDLILQVRQIKDSDFFEALHKESLLYEILSKVLRLYVKNLEKQGEVMIKRENLLLIKNISDHIEDHLFESLTIKDICNKFNIGQAYLQECFKIHFDCTVNDFIQRKRLEVAKNLLDTEDFNISEISFKVGINSKSYFSKIFKERYGISPSEYKRSRLKNIRHI